MVPRTKYDIEVMKGETFVMDISMESAKNGTIPLTNYQIQAQVRKNPGDPNLVAQMQCVLSSDGSAVTLVIPENETLDIHSGTYAYDVVFKHDGTVEYVLGGRFIVHDNVTEWE